MSSSTLFDKIWNRHVVCELPSGGHLLYIDRHLVHEVTSPQAFEGLREASRSVRRPDLTFATVDHNVPTHTRHIDARTLSGQQMLSLEKNCKEFGIPYFQMGDVRQGIVHVIGPELGLTLPGLTIVCGDSHTSTHGAFGALAFGIGTSEVEHVLATQTLRVPIKPKSLGVKVSGRLGRGLSAKDVILAIIRKLGAAGGTGYVVEYYGETIESMPMHGRMTVCNMSIEMGARAGMIAPDEVTLNYILEKDRPYAPKKDRLQKLKDLTLELKTDSETEFDRREVLEVTNLHPQISWGTNPAMTVGIHEKVPEPKNESEKRALEYMGLIPGTRVQDVPIDVVFLGSCTNSRIDDLREAAEVIKGRKIAEGVRGIVVPGSESVKQLAEKEGLDKIYKEAGFEWHFSGCSMCLGMNGDIVLPRKRCASTSNRPYEGRQGPGARTHLMSPCSAAATAIKGKIADPRDLL